MTASKHYAVQEIDPRAHDFGPYIEGDRLPHLCQSSQHQVAYVTIARGDIANTISVHPQVNIDVDEQGDVLGVELFGVTW